MPITSRIPTSSSTSSLSAASRIPNAAGTSSRRDDDTNHNKTSASSKNLPPPQQSSHNATSKYRLRKAQLAQQLHNTTNKPRLTDPTASANSLSKSSSGGANSNSHRHRYSPSLTLAPRPLDIARRMSSPVKEQQPEGGQLVRIADGSSSAHEEEGGGAAGLLGESEVPEEGAPAELSAVVDELLDGLSHKFAGVSKEIYARMDDMSRRLDSLEAALLADGTVVTEDEASSTSSPSMSQK